MVDFDGGPTGLFASVAFGGVTFTGTGAPVTVGSDFNGIYNTSGVNSMYNDFDYLPDAFRFDFASPVGAFGFNWGAADNLWTLSAFDWGGLLIESTTIPAVFGSNAWRMVWHRCERDCLRHPGGSEQLLRRGLRLHRQLHPQPRSHRSRAGHSSAARWRFDRLGQPQEAEASPDLRTSAQGHRKGGSR